MFSQNDGVCCDYRCHILITDRISNPNLNFLFYFGKLQREHQHVKYLQHITYNISETKVTSSPQLQHILKRQTFIGRHQ